MKKSVLALIFALLVLASTVSLAAELTTVPYTQYSSGGTATQLDAVILFENSNLAVCLTLLIAAIATAIIIIADKEEKKEFPTAIAGTSSYPPKKGELIATPQQKLRKSIKSVIWIVGICFYLLISFVSGAWFITWLVFLILPATQGLVNAIFDLKEAE